MAHSITCRVEFDYAHRVLGHEGKCRHLHGHHGVAEITMAAGLLDNSSMVYDFGDVKKTVKDWIDANWDHNILLHPDDPLAILYRNMGDNRISLADYETDKVMGSIDPIFDGKAPYLMAPGCQPTAERMAETLYWVCTGLFPIHRAAVTRVRVYETPAAWADYFRHDD